MPMVRTNGRAYSLVVIEILRWMDYQIFLDIGLGYNDYIGEISMQ